MTTRVVPLADAAAGCGGKAAHLARLIAAGLPVPDGFALGHDAFAAVVGDGPIELDAVGHALAERAARAASAPVPPELAAEVERRAAGLGRVVVRSSVSIEDQAGGGAPGVFASVVDVAPADVWAAIRAVWASAMSPLAAAYARHRGVARADVGVIVQRFVPGPRRTIYTRPPGRPDDDEVWIEPAGGALVVTPREGDDAGVRLALAAEAAIGAIAGADVELVDAAGGPVVVQARPIRHPAAAPTRPPPPPSLFGFTRATPGTPWRWDVAHNPEPMSEAQVGLVELIDAAGAAPYRMRAVAGYLYWATEPGAAPRPAPPASADALAARWAALDARMIAALDAAGPAPALGAALDAYVAFYQVWAFEVAPLLAAARADLPARLAEAAVADAERVAAALAGPRTTTVAAHVAAAARGDLDDAGLLAAIGDFAPIWDVAAPTYAETPEAVRAAVARAAGRAAPAPAADDEAARRALGDGLEQARALARLAADLSELDDARFARAQVLVRGALRRAADRLGVDPDDVFWLPLDEIAAAAPGELDPVTAAARASAARAAAARAAGWAMPLSVVDGEPVAAATPRALRGTGTGPRVMGPVAHVAGATPAPLGAIAVVRAVTPALALALDEAAAIVAEHGGALDHGAALARELGIPCVTGCAGAWDALADGQLVVVDGDAGVVAPA